MSSTLILLLLAAWVLAIVLFASMQLIDRLLWVQVVLGVAGVFGAILPLAISPYTAFMMNAITLGIFIISLQMFKARSAGCRAIHEKHGFGPEASVVRGGAIHHSSSRWS